MGAIDNEVAQLLGVGGQTPKTVEQYLNEIDYTVDADYVPSDFALSFVAFIKLVTDGEGEENETPLVHYKMLDGLVTGHNRLLNMCSRGLGKTSLFAEFLIFYLAVYGYLPKFGKVDFVLYVSDSIDNGVKSLRKNLEYRWENSDFLQKYLPSVKWTDIRYEFTNADGNKFVVKAFGAKTGVRGTKEMGKRPQIAILDDLISDEDARSETVIKSIEATVSKAIEYALHPSQNMIVWSGTPFNARDPLYKAVESGKWVVNVYPVCEQFPCTREEFKGAWSDRFDYDYVKQQFTNALLADEIASFDQELMLRIMSEEDRLVPDSYILWYSLRQLIQRKSDYNYYITTDFATSEKQSSDFSVISVWGYNHNGDWYYVDGICIKQTMDKNIDDLFELVTRWNPQEVGVEISGQQAGFLSWIQREMMNRNIFFSLASDKKSNESGLRPNLNKMQRFNQILPQIKLKKVFWPSELSDSDMLVEGMNELRLVAQSGMRSKHDDFLDTLSMLSELKPWKPSNEVEPMEKQATNDAIWGTPINTAPEPYQSYIV